MITWAELPPRWALRLVSTVEDLASDTGCNEDHEGEDGCDGCALAYVLTKIPTDVRIKAARRLR